MDANLSTLGGPLRRSILAELPIRDTLPAIQSLLVDSRGWLWAEAFDLDSAQPKEWMVFDPEGEAQGVVWTPPGLEVESIGEDFILGVWLDEFDVEYIRLYRLNRGG